VLKTMNTLLAEVVAALATLGPDERSADLLS
jgi:hypothetical protein